MVYEALRKITLLRKLHFAYVSECRKRVWMGEAKKIKPEINPILQEKFEMPQKTMIILPHSDDEWVGCSQIISNWKNVILCDVNMSGGDSEEMHLKRKEELKNTSRLFGANLIETSIDTLSNIIVDEMPDAICVPFYMDWHDEHLRVLEEISTNLSTLPPKIKVFSYQVSVPIPNKFINYSIPMTKKEHKKKWNYFKTNYKTQVIIPFMRFASNEIVNGGCIGAYSAEVFRVSPSLEIWNNEYKKYRLPEDERKTVIKSLHSIKETRGLLLKYIGERDKNE